METNNEIQKVEPITPNQMIQLAIENKSDLGQVRELLELKKLYEADEARKDFASEFATVQANMGAVIKTAKNNQTNSKYAKLEGVIEVAKPVYAEHGFSVIFYEGKSEELGNVRVYADVLHKAGHKETYHLDVPLDGVGIKGNANMTKIHGKASSVSYGRRYLLCMIWNIPTEDDDGNAAGVKPKKEVEIKEPTPAEQEILTEIVVYLIDSTPEGKLVDESKIGPLLYGRWHKYPQNAETGAKDAADWIVNKSGKFEELLIDAPKTDAA